MPADNRLNLPAENWLCIFSYIPRHLLANNVALASRQFSAIAEYWLNEKCGKVTLRRLVFAPKLKNNQKEEEGKMGIWNECGDQMPFPRADMPANIVDFSIISIVLPSNQKKSTWMKPVVEMLAKMGRQKLLANSNISLREKESAAFDEEDDEELCSIAKMTNCSNDFALTALIPVLEGCLVESISCIPNDGLLNAPNYFCPLFTNLRVLHLGGERDLSDETMDFLAYWATDANYAELDGAADSRLMIVTVSDVDASEIIWRLRQKFFTQNRPATFFVHMKISNRTLRPLPEFTLRNTERREVYNLERLNAAPNNHFLLGRYPTGATREWLEQQRETILGWNFDGQKRRIVLQVGQYV